jgi:hypothetical protein
MFTIVVIGVAVGVFTMYVRHDRQMRRKRSAEPTQPAPSESPPPETKRP